MMVVVLVLVPAQGLPSTLTRCLKTGSPGHLTHKARITPPVSARLSLK